MKKTKQGVLDRMLDLLKVMRKKSRFEATTVIIRCDSFETASMICTEVRHWPGVVDRTAEKTRD